MLENTFKWQVVLVDDLDGGPADETVTFSLDGVSYEIDLTHDNAAALRDALQNAKRVVVLEKCLAVGLGGIFQHEQVVFRRDRHDRIHVSHLAEQVNRDDGFRARRDGGFDRSRVHSEADRIDVDEHRFCARVVDG